MYSVLFLLQAMLRQQTALPPWLLKIQIAYNLFGIAGGLILCVLSELFS